MASKVNPVQHGCTSGTGTKEAPSQEVAPWNPSTTRDLSLPEDNGTLYPKGSLYMVNKIKYMHFMSKTSKIVKIHVLQLFVRMSKTSKIVKIHVL